MTPSKYQHYEVFNYIISKYATVQTLVLLDCTSNFFSLKIQISLVIAREKLQVLKNCN